MNAKAVGFIIGAVVFVLLCRGCLMQERRATLHAIAINMPNCKESSVDVSEDADSFIYRTKSGNLKCFDVKWIDGKPKLYEIPL